MSFSIGDRVVLNNDKYKGFLGTVKGSAFEMFYKVKFDNLGILLTCLGDDLKLVN